MQKYTKCRDARKGVSKTYSIQNKWHELEVHADHAPEERATTHLKRSADTATLQQYEKI